MAWAGLGTLSSGGELKTKAWFLVPGLPLGKPLPLPGLSFPI